MFTNALLLVAGGSLGTLTRYSVSLVAVRVGGGAFPLGTSLVNLVGCFLIGVAYALAEEKALLPHGGRLFFMTGFLGALTTFSTYALETVVAARGESLGLPIANIVVNNVGGLLMVVLGIWAVRIS